MNLEKSFDAILKENHTLQLHVEVTDWKGAIQAAVALLVKAKMATSEYANAIIAATEEFGPYYLVADHVAMPHAKSGPYNLANGFSMITLAKPVHFGDVPISVVICLSSTTSDFHVASALPQIAALFEDENMGAKLAQCPNEQAVYQLISNIDFSKYLD